ncbi:MAG: S-layer protein, partial [Candidatus Diapherotrites archaeon]|nr:S-layer protein [Candidatus Diapherotrites archaeon]
GDTVVAQEVVAENDDTDFDGVLSGKVRVDTAFAGAIERNSYVNLMLDTESLTLEDGKDFELDEEWEVTIETTETLPNVVAADWENGDKVDSITLTNKDVSWSSDEEKLLWNVSGRTKAQLPNDFAEVVFKGLEAEDTEDIRVSENTLEFSDGDDDYKIHFFDVGGTSGTLDLAEGVGSSAFEYELVESDLNNTEFFLYVDVEGDGLDEDYGFDNLIADDFDEQEDDDVRLGIDFSGGFATWGDEDTTAFDASAGVTDWIVDFDGNGDANSAGDLELTYMLVWDGEEDDLYAYVVDVRAESEYGADFEFWTDLDFGDNFDGGDYDTTSTSYADVGFMPLIDDLGTTAEGSVMPNILVILDDTEDHDEEWTVKLDPTDGSLIEEDTDDYADDSTTVELLVGSNLSTDDDELRYITDFGTIGTLDSGGDDFVLTIPDKQRIAQMAIGMESTTEGGQSVTTLAEGESTVIGGVTVTVSAIDVAVTPGEVIGGDAATGTCVATPSTYTVTTVQDVGNLVFTDNQTLRSGNLVLVGGPVVNDLTADLGSATELGIASSGQKVVALKGNKLVVAGNTADDTVQAGQELISWLKANV